ncbi:hypothetical protein UPYG_G00253270 [Umbra pygmaea]|uniref:SOGA 1/2-like coiled-coil domain-containing protein n=1 Tax=Umbra pygmaea TaxID=75934 RepID=A0ABD0W7Y0_UMBPY
MAAIELQCSGQGWGAERVELQDSFDSEMQEWEEQLQDMQRKIEELYNEVQARRGGNDVIIDNGRNPRMRHGNNFSDPFDSHSTKTNPRVVDRYSNGCKHGPGSYGDPVNHDGYNYSNSAVKLEDLLQDYLGHGHGKARKTNSALNNITKWSPDESVPQDELKRRPPGNDRIGQVRFVDEEVENRKNSVSYRKSSPSRDLNKENTGTKFPLRQKEGPPVPPRSTSQMYLPESSSVLDRKYSSPSVLRKFGAMLQENEGKTLTDTGVVTNHVPADNKSPTPVCLRKGLAGSRAPGPIPVRRCQEESIAGDTRKEGGFGGEVKEYRGTSVGSHSHPKEAQAGGQRMTQVGGSPKPKVRFQRGADRDACLQPGEPRVEYRNLSESHVGAQMIRKGGPSAGQKQSEGLIELLDMLEIEHEYRTCPRTAQNHYRHTQQLTPDESSLAAHARNFSRPARPANQRPPSRTPMTDLCPICKY